MGRLFYSFRFRLAAIVLAAALIPLVAIGTVTLEMAERYMAAQTMRNHQAIIDAFSSGMDLYIDNQVDELSKLAKEPQIQSFSEKELKDGLNEYLTEQTFFTKLYVYDREGIICGAAARFHKGKLDEVLGKDVNKLEVPLHRSVAKSFNKALSSLDVVRCADVIFLTPITDFSHPEKVIGLLAGEAVFDGSEIQDIVASYPARGNEYICILNEGGEIEAYKGEGLARADRFILPKIENKTAIGTYEVDNGGRTDLLTLSRSKSLGGWVAIGRPAREAFDYLNDLHANFLVIILLAIVLAAGAAFYIAWSISQPIAALTEGLVKVRDGVFSHRVDVQSEDELGEASQALNMLAETFQKKRVVGSIWETMRADVSTSGSR